MAMTDEKTGLTHKELSLADAYLNNGFNELKAYESSEYSQNCTIATKRANTTKTLKKPHVKAYIAQKIQEIKDNTVASRIQRQEFWTRIMNGKLDGVNVSVADRLKASELLGRSEADFTDNTNLTDITQQRELAKSEKVEAELIAGIRIKQFAKDKAPQVVANKEVMKQ